MAYEHLKKLLIKHGKSQKDLADLINKTEAVITNLFNGTRKLAVTEGQKIADWLKEPIEFVLFGIEGEGNIPKIYIKGSVPGGLPSEAISVYSEDYVYFKSNRLPGDVGGLIVIGDSMNNIAPDGSVVIVDFTRHDKEDLDGKPVIAYAYGECTFKRLCLNPNLLLPDSTNKTHKPIPLDGDWHIVGAVIGVVNRIEE